MHCAPAMAFFFFGGGVNFFLVMKLMHEKCTHCGGLIFVVDILNLVTKLSDNVPQKTYFFLVSTFFRHPVKKMKK